MKNKQPYKRGLLRKSHRNVLAMATWAGPDLAAVAAPAEWCVVCKDYNVAGNDQYGDCVTAEEANSKDAWAVVVGKPEPNITTAEVVAWARKRGYLNGATLSDVLYDMCKTGLTDPRGIEHKNGQPKTVDWRNQAEMQAACYQYKTIKIAIAASQVQAAHKPTNGWTLRTARPTNRLDHCVALHGYGSAAYLAKACGVTLPSTWDPATPAWLMYTWGSVGIVSWQALSAIMGEAWIRDPGDVTNEPAPPTPEPTPQPPGPTPDPTPGPKPKPTARGIRIAQKAQEMYAVNPAPILLMLDMLETYLQIPKDISDESLAILSDAIQRRGSSY